MHIYAAILFFSAGISVTLAGLAWHRPLTQGSRVLSFLLLAAAWTTMAHGLGLTSTSLPAKVLWNHVEYTGLVFFSPLMLGASLFFAGKGRWLRPAIVSSVLLIPLLRLIANWTNSMHGLYHRHVWLESSGLCTLLAWERGPLYLPFILYSYLLIAASVGIVLHYREHTQGAARIRLALLAFAFVLPLFFNAIYQLRVLPPAVPNLTPLGFFLCAALLAQAMLRYRLTEIIPFAREQIFEQSPVAMLLLDAEKRVLDLNQKGADLMTSFASPLAPQQGDTVKGSPTSAWRWHLDGLADLIQATTPGAATLSGGEHSFHASMTDLRAPNQELLGHVLSIQDVTAEHLLIDELRASQERLNAANASMGDLIARQGKELQAAMTEALKAGENEARHIGQEIHDTLGQELVGLTRMAENMGRGTCPDNTCREQLLRLGGQASHAARMAREIAQNLTLNDLENRELTDALEAFAQRLEQMFDITVDISSTPEVAELTPHQSNQVYRIIREAAINAVKHARAQKLWVDILFEREQMIVSITNNGKPLAPESDRLGGLGLQHMRMRAGMLNGALSIGQRLEDKTVVELTFPLRVP